jgi:kynurenine formamidase
LQPNSYDVDIASSKPVETNDFTGDTRKGGSCNFEEIKFIPHCNGTHTECVGHISYDRISIQQTLKDSFSPAVLITVKPVIMSLCKDKYEPDLKHDDLVITADAINEEIKKFGKNLFDALVIRTLPNDLSKKSRRYMELPPPFFSIEAMELISGMNVNHLLVDIPSVDRSFDEGKLTAHHIFWDVELKSHDVDARSHSSKTITEMIYVPDEISDGEYLLNLQIAPFVSDASSSRPVLFKIKNL